MPCATYILFNRQYIEINENNYIIAMENEILVSLVLKLSHLLNSINMIILIFLTVQNFHF